MTQSGATPRMDGREWAMLLVLAVLWGGSFFFNGVAVRELPSFTLVWLRAASAAGAPASTRSANPSVPLAGHFSEPGLDANANG